MNKATVVKGFVPIFVCPPLRAHPVSVHLGWLDDCVGLPGQDREVLGPEDAQLCEGGGNRLPRLRWVLLHTLLMYRMYKEMFILKTVPKYESVSILF